MYIAADNSFTDQKKQGVSKSLKSASFHAEIMDSIKFGMRSYLNGAKEVERRNLNGIIEVLRMKNMQPVWLEIGKPVPVKELISPAVYLVKEVTEQAKKCKELSTEVDGNVIHVYCMDYNRLSINLETYEYWNDSYGDEYKFGDLTLGKVIEKIRSKPKLSKKLKCVLTQIQKTGGEINIDCDQKHYMFIPYESTNSIQLTSKQTDKIIAHCDSVDYHLGKNYIFNKS